MSGRSAFLAILHLFTVFSFFAAALFVMAVRYLPNVRMRIVDFLIVDFERCSLIGFMLLLAAAILLLSFYLLEKGSFLVIRMGLSIDLKLVKSAVEECFSRQLCRKVSLLDVELADEMKLEMKVAIQSEEKEEDLLQQTEKELAFMLAKRFGYQKSFALIVAQKV